MSGRNGRLVQHPTAYPVRLVSYSNMVDEMGQQRELRWALVVAGQVASELGEELSQNEPSELIAEIILIDSHQAEEAALVRIERYLLLFGCIA
jgi:hypothetical protein